MKPVLLIAALLISNLIFAQDKIEGIGPFKINRTTTAYVDTLVNDGYKKITVKTADPQSTVRGLKEKAIAELMPDSTKLYNSPHTHRCNGVRTFFIPFMEIAGITIENIYLTFYHDVLVDISTDYSAELKNALMLKYGEVPAQELSSENNCTLPATKADMSLTAKSYYYTWKNEGIKCIASIGYYWDHNCEKQYLSYVNVGVSGITSVIMDCDRAEREKQKKRQDEEKRKKLGEL
ncbi:hypothetical protein [Taibaiella soli]|nr:hypothetical protein [Taibaiella soli]